MSLQTRIKTIENKIGQNKPMEHTETPIVPLSEELKKKYKHLPYPIMGGLSTK